MYYVVSKPILTERSLIIHFCHQKFTVIRPNFNYRLERKQIPAVDTMSVVNIRAKLRIGSHASPKELQREMLIFQSNKKS